MAVKVDIHGSCVSRSCFELLDRSEVQVGQYFARNNIVSCMMPPAELSFTHGELVQYNSAYSEGCMRFALNKRTLPKLLDSDAKYLAIDFFDFCQPVVAFFDTTFSSYDYTFFNTSAYRNSPERFASVDWLSVPSYIWYGYVDAYFNKVKEKFQNGIILNRLNCSNIYLSKTQKICMIPENRLHFGNANYNQALYELENYVIDRYQPYVIDISKYFIPDEAFNPDVTPVHYEENYNNLQSSMIKEIVTGIAKSKGRYFDVLPILTVVNLLKRPVSEAEFLELYQQRELPFNSNTLLDYIFQTWDLQEVAQNRVWIADLYERYAAVQNDIHLNGGSLCGVLADENIWYGLPNDTLKRGVYQYLNMADECLKQSVSELYSCFLSDFECSHSYEWMLELNLLSVLEPDYESIPLYLTHFYEAVGDIDSLRKLVLQPKAMSSGGQMAAQQGRF